MAATSLLHQSERELLSYPRSEYYSPTSGGSGGIVTDFFHPTTTEPTRRDFHRTNLHHQEDFRAPLPRRITGRSFQVAPVERIESTRIESTEKNQLRGHFTPVWTNHSTELFVFLCLNIFVVISCCSCLVKYLFLFVFFSFFRRSSGFIVPDKPHWESNGRGKKKQETTDSTGG